MEEEKATEEERREEAKYEVEERPEKKFTTKGLSKGLSLLNKLLAQGMDGNVKRFSRVEPMAEDRFVHIVKFMRRKRN